MKIRDLLGFSIRNLWRRKLRTFLTILGVIIGAASIVIMLSLGIALNQSYEEQISQMGSLNTITVYRSYNYDPSVKDSDQVIIDDAAIAAFEAIPGVELASPLVELQLKMVSGKYTTYLSVRGIKPQMLIAQDLKVEAGRLLDETDELSLLIGGGVKYTFYNPNDRSGGMGGGMYGMKNYGDGSIFESPVDFLNDTLKVSYDMNFGEKRQPGQVTGKKVKPYTVKAVGVMKEGQGEHDYFSYMAIDQAKKLLKEKEKYDASLIPAGTGHTPKKKEEGYNTAYVQVMDMEKVKEVQDQVKAMGYEAYSLMEYLDTMQKTAAGIQAVLGGIGAVSLLVAALGITNTMIMSIYERTKEIGVMKVIGASLPDIKKMFLAEAAMIGFFGGLLGLGVSFLGSHLLNYVSKNGSIFGGMPGSKMSVIPIWLYLLSITFTTLVGIVSGYLPAIKAMRLSVLKALRTE
ncbi:MAG: ABC transporter permease [Vallitaleaceae bacterium]|nr:ABC transporter permease [Vallitaleaceae bacterium]